MSDERRLLHGSAAWFDMVGTVMAAAAVRSNLPETLTISFLERYINGTELAAGLMQGLRFDVENGQPSYRAGVQRGETADIVIEITTEAARALNLLRRSDPAHGEALDQFIRSGEMRVTGDPTRLGRWLDTVHDAIAERTRAA